MSRYAYNNLRKLKEFHKINYIATNIKIPIKTPIIMSEPVYGPPTYEEAMAPIYGPPTYAESMSQMPVNLGSSVSLLDQLGVQPVRVVDTRVNIDKTLKWTFLQGPTLTSFQQYNANSQDTTSLSFNCNPPSMDTIVDRKMRLLFPVQLTFNGHTGTQQTASAGSTANKLLSYGNGDAFRANPVSSIISGITMQINGGNVNLPLYDVIQPLSRFAKKSVLDQEWSCTTSFQDTYQEYYQGFYSFSSSWFIPSNSCIR
jgi:hypothetical protein